MRSTRPPASSTLDVCRALRAQVVRFWFVSETAVCNVFSKRYHTTISLFIRAHRSRRILPRTRRTRGRVRCHRRCDGVLSSDRTDTLLERLDNGRQTRPRHKIYCGILKQSVYSCRFFRSMYDCFALTCKIESSFCCFCDNLSRSCVSELDSSDSPTITGCPWQLSHGRFQIYHKCKRFSHFFGFYFAIRCKR